MTGPPPAPPSILAVCEELRRVLDKEPNRRVFYVLRSELDTLLSHIRSQPAVGEEVLAMARRLVAAGDVLANGLEDGPVDTPERHAQLQAFFDARRVIANPEPLGVVNFEAPVVVLARALLSLAGDRNRNLPDGSAP